MKAKSLDGTLLGTFNGRAERQFGIIGTKIDVLLRDSYVDTDTGERVYQITLRAHKPVDEFRMQLELPAHGWRKLAEEVQRESED